MSSSPCPLNSMSSKKYPTIKLCHECGEEHFPYKVCPHKTELCDECGNKHGYFARCPYMPCKLCYKKDHYIGFCPFLKCYPRGEDFDTAKYEIVCRCGYPFVTDKWLCTSCRFPSPKLQIKYCEICQAVGDHIVTECPKDKERTYVPKSKLDAFLATLEVNTFPNLRSPAEAPSSEGIPPYSQKYG